MTYRRAAAVAVLIDIVLMLPVAMRSAHQMRKTTHEGSCVSIHPGCGP